MKKNKGKIKLREPRKFLIMPEPVYPTKAKPLSMAMLIKEAIFFSKSGSTQKEIGNWIKLKHNVEPKHLSKLIQKTLKKLVQLKFVYIHKQKPKRYRLTAKGKTLKQALRTKQKKRKIKKKERRDKVLPVKCKHKK